jgi:hypothetical protein
VSNSDAGSESGHTAIADFIAAHADAWNSGDVEAIADAMGLPQMIADGAGTTFIEADDELDAWIDDRLARWEAHGVAGVTAVVEHIEDLPDDAARVTSRWRLVDGGGATLATFAAVDTLASDDGDWYFVVTDVAGEEGAEWVTPESPGSGRS